MKRSSKPPGRGARAAEAELEASFERARDSASEERAFFKRLMDAIVYVHAPVSDDARTLRLVQFRHPDGFDAIPFFTSLGKAQVASSAAVKILGVSGHELLTGTRDVPPILSSTAIWSPIPNHKEIGREEALFRRTDHRLPA